MSTPESSLPEIKALSPTEQRIYSALYSKRVITTSDVRKILSDPHKAADYITNLQKKGFMVRIRKGIHALVPPNLAGRNIHPDKYLVASKLAEKSFISHHTALELHGFAQSVTNTVYVTTPNRSLSFSFANVEYHLISTKFFFGETVIEYQGQKMKVSDRERTILDCIRRLSHAGGLEEILKSIKSIPWLDEMKLLEYLDHFGQQSLYHKAGFILEACGIRISKDALEEMKKKVGERVYYLEKGRKSSLNKGWNLMIPDAFSELMQGG